jgi:hypothetical protein
VNVYPQIIQIIEFEEPIEIHCSVENADENTRILWNFDTDALDPEFVQPNNTVYIPVSSRNFTGKYSCIAISYNHEIVDSATVVIEYPAMLLEPTSESKQKFILKLSSVVIVTLFRYFYSVWN